jgi:hypothetical protein
MVGLLEDRMVVLTECQRPDTGSSNSQKGEECRLSENKPGGAAVEGSRPAGMGLRVGAVGRRGMFRGSVRCCS